MLFNLKTSNAILWCSWHWQTRFSLRNRWAWRYGNAAMHGSRAKFPHWDADFLMHNTLRVKPGEVAMWWSLLRLSAVVDDRRRMQLCLWLSLLDHSPCWLTVLFLCVCTFVRIMSKSWQLLAGECSYYTQNGRSNSRIKSYHLMLRNQTAWLRSKTASACGLRPSWHHTAWHIASLLQN